ncbi:MAG: chemotaxis protein CheW [Eubacteriales bacterium]
MAEENRELSEREKQLVVFHLSEQTYGTDIASVYEIIRMDSISRVPRTPDFVEGVINLRGKIIPVIDLCKRLNLTKTNQTDSKWIIIADIAGITIGMIVDAVSEVLRISNDRVEPPPPVVHGVDSAYLKGVAIVEEGLIILLDIKQVLLKQEKNELKGLRLESA